MCLKWLGFTALLSGITCAGCGYRSANSVPAHAPLGVTAAPFKTPHPEALEAALSGVRAGLSQSGVLAPGDAYPRVVVELLRVDELPAGIAATGPSEAAVPLARGSAVGVVGRVWVLSSAGAPPANDTGDVRRVEYVAQSSEPVTSRFAYASAVRSAARKLGEALARRILGSPEPGTDPM